MLKIVMLITFSFFLNLGCYAFEYVLPKPQNDKDPRQIYRLLLLQLALDKTKKEYGETQARFSFEVANHKRAVDEIKKNTGFVTIIALPKSKELLKNMYLIDFEILNKINHYRLAFVNKKFLNQFQSAKSADDLKKLPLCRKKDWSDGVYEPNGFSIEYGSSYEGIFKMLNEGRCVWFARGINEIFDEDIQYKALLDNVVIDNKIALNYVSNMTFFVSKQNEDAGIRILKGLKIAKQDGSFQKLFDESYKDDLKRANLSERKVFNLKSYREE